jgi:hypothetical protein
MIGNTLEKGMKMIAGNIIAVKYNGKKYTGLVDTIRMVKGRDMITLVIVDDQKATGQGFRSLYLDKMESVEQIGFAEGYPLPFAE